jgi:DGQHR domain-containing protein
MRSSQSQALHIRAMRITQRQDAPLYVFGINGPELAKIGTANRAQRDSGEGLSGYQRPEVASHIREIAHYLESPRALLPNAIIVAFDQIDFVPDSGVQPTWGTFGTLHIPIVRSGRAYRSGWIVDGQQRAAALASLPADRKFPVVVIGFHAADEALQAEQFILVNRTKPLPRDLMVELLADVESSVPLPASLATTRLASKVIRTLRKDSNSVFYHRIRGFEERGQSARISQAAVVEVITSGMRRGGAFLGDDGPRPADDIAGCLSNYYGAIAQLWPNAWRGSPWTSRLVHGVGIVSLGRLMPSVLLDLGLEAADAPFQAKIAKQLKPLVGRCSWNSGRWEDIDREWYELQNTATDKNLLTAELMRLYAEYC